MTRLSPGSALGRYEVIAHIGRGGMGDVYRARDTTLDKTVALKTIAVAYAQDPASQLRFERERRLTASLEHPHICRLLDAGREGGIDYLAMEYLDGQSLAERLDHGRVPVDQAIGYAIEIAEALEYAHARGVIHRDLKPANVFLTATGAKVLDFGLAKLRPSGDGAAAAGETVPLDATQHGMLIGSAPYMPPERLEGRDADVRSDVFAFGVLLYEMLAGRRAFNADSPAALIAAILTTEPAPLALEHPKGDDLEWLVRRCLAKNPDARWQSIADVRAILKRLAGPGLSEAKPATLPLLPATIAILAATAVLVVWMLARRAVEPQDAAPVVFSVHPPQGGSFTPTQQSEQTAQFAVAPDGRSLVFVASGPDRVSRVWVRDLGSLTARALAGTEEATYPFWSPDAKSVGFFADQALKRIDVAGGPSRTLAPASSGRGGSWSTTGEILFAPDAVGAIRRVSATGGNTADATQLVNHRGETSHRWPVFLPDGRRFLYFARSETVDNEGIYLGSLAGDRPAFLAQARAGGVFLPPDRIVFLATDTLVARRIDFARGALVGDPTVIAEDAARSSSYYGAYSASATGVIVYASGASISDLAWVDRTGQLLGTVSSSRQHVDFRLSPNGELLASAEVDPGSDGSDIYVLDLARGTRLRVTASRFTDATPVWAPQNQRLVFRTNPKRVHDLFVKDPFANAPEQLFYASKEPKYPTSWSRTGGWIAFHTRSEETGWDVAVAPTTGVVKPRLVLHSRFNERQAQFSPDGRWIAYTSDESNQDQVYVQSLDDRATRVNISVNGGDEPRWRSDGAEMFYVSPDGYLMAVPLREEGGGIAPELPRQLFRLRTGPAGSSYLSSYDVHPDGRRFIIRVPRDDARSLPLTVLVNRRLAAGP